MAEGPAEGQAGDSLDWIAGGLEIKELKDLGNACPLKTIHGVPMLITLIREKL